MDSPIKTMQRSLGLPAVVAVSISAMLGSGIFVLPGLAAAHTGPSMFLAYLLAGVLVIPAAVSKSELGTAMPASGGTYIYIDRAYGPLAGTVAGLGLWVSLLLKSAFALVGMGAYLSVVAHVPLNTVALLVITAIVLINIRGIKGVGQAQLIMVVVSLLALVGMVAVGITAFEPKLTEPAFTGGVSGLLVATGLVFVSYDGVTKVAAIAEEIKDPGRNLPAGILISLLVVAAVYTTVTFVLAGNIPQETLQGDLHPIYTLAAKEGGMTLGIPIAVIGALTMASMANAGLLAASRFPFAMSRENLLPAFLGQLHPKQLTPAAAVIASGIVMAAAIIFLDVERIAKLASSFVILIFMAESLTVMVLRESRVKWYRPTYRSPFYPWLQLFGIVSGLVLLVVMGSLVVVGIAMVALPGMALYWLYGRRRTMRRGVVAQRGPRQDLLRGTDVGVATVEETSIEGPAQVLVPLFGNERSPEMLVEVAAGLANKQRTQVLHLTEIPEQTTLQAAADEEDLSIASLTRRIGAMAESLDTEILFDAVVSRDIVKTVHQMTEELQSDWLIVEWGGRSGSGFTIENPLGWLEAHTRCNLATFYDAGVRYIRKILVYVEPGPHDALVVSTADHLATVHGADLTFIRFVPNDAAPTVTQSVADYLDQVRQLSTAPSKTLLVKGADEALAISKSTGGYDMLVMSATPGRWFWSRWFGSERDQIMAQAACSVLRVQAPRERTHEAFTAGRHDSVNFNKSQLAGFIDHGCVQAKLKGMRKEALFSHFGKLFSGVVDDVSTDDIVAALWQRERMQNTSVGDGLALPHATIGTEGKTRLGVITLESPIKYQAPDGGDVDILFVTLGSPRDRQKHLLLLSSIAKLVMGTQLLERLRAADNIDEILAAIEQCSRELQE